MIKLFTHTDLDGVGCAVLAKLAFGDEVDIEYCNYDDIDERVRKFLIVMKNSDTHVDAIYITDISVNEVTAGLMSIPMEYGTEVRLFDHHKTAEHLNKYAWAEVSEFDGELGFKTCGTEMFYKYLVEKGLIKDTEKHRTFVWAVNAYDTWHWKQMGEEEGWMIKEFNDLLYILGRDEFIDRCIRRKRVKGDDSMILPSKDERMLLDRRQAEIDAYIFNKYKEMKVVETEDGYCGVVFADRFVSELGNKICEESSEIDYIVIVDPGAMKVSLRTVKDGVDVGVIANKQGGGGHKAAAGYHFNCALQGVMVEAALKRIIIADYTPDEPQPEEKLDTKSWWNKWFGGKK